MVMDRIEELAKWGFEFWKDGASRADEDWLEESWNNLPEKHKEEYRTSARQICQLIEPKAAITHFTDLTPTELDAVLSSLGRFRNKEMMTEPKADEGRNLRLICLLTDVTVAAGGGITPASRLTQQSAF
jgi:hypothetical protein